MLGWGADPNGQQGQFPRTPLTQAAHFDRLECARILIEIGAELERLNKSTWTALQEARSADMVALLLDAGADIEAKSSPSPSPLFWACLRREAETAQALIERGAEIEPLNCSPLCRAVESGQIGIVRLLLQRGARVWREVVEPTPYLFDALARARQGNPVNPVPVNDEIVALLEEAQQRQSI